MNNSSRLLSDEVKWSIVSQHKAGNGPKQIIQNIETEFNRSIYKSTIYGILDKYEQTGDVANAWSGGRPPLFNKEETRKIQKEVRRKNTLTAVDISRNPTLNIHGASTRTIERVLLNEGLISSTNIPCYLTPKQRQSRVSFCKEYRNKPPSFWHSALFSDECDLNPTKCGKKRIRRRVGEEVEVNMGPDDKWDLGP